MTKRPAIETNEGPPDKFVQITANIVARPDSTYPIVIKPYKLDLTQFGEKVRSEAKFNLINMTEADLKPTLVASYDQLMEVTLPKVIPAGKSAEGVVKLKKSALDQSFDKSLTIQLNDEKNSRFTIPVKRQVRGTAVAAPTGAAVAVPDPHSSGH